MEFLKKLFRNYWILSVFCIVLGVALIVNPAFFTNAIGYTVGGLFAAYGVVELVKYFVMGKDNEYTSSLVRGIILCAIGVFVIIKPDFIPKVIAIFCGFYMTISGIVNIQSALNIRRSGVDNWKVSCITAVITTVIGVVLLLNPLAPVNIAMMILGASLLISGLTNIIGSFDAGRQLKKMSKLARYEKNDNDNNNDNDKFIDV